MGNDDDVRAVVLGQNGALAAMKPGAILVDHTTASADLARELAVAAQQQGKQFLDAPVAGGQAGAENGALTVMIGGEPSTYDLAKSVIDCYSRFSKLLGPAGHGPLANMVNEMWIAGVVQGLAEGLSFAMKAGLEGEALIETISKGAAGSWQMENRYQTMLQDQYEFGFAVDWMRKDLGIALAEAAKNGAELPVTALVDSFYQEVRWLAVALGYFQLANPLHAVVINSAKFFQLRSSPPGCGERRPVLLIIVRQSSTFTHSYDNIGRVKHDYQKAILVHDTDNGVLYRAAARRSGANGLRGSQNGMGSA